MSLAEWTFLHRLDRHLELLTPPLVLVLACAIGRFRGDWRAWASLVALAALVCTSWPTIRHRYRSLRDDVALMRPVHELLSQEAPSVVYADTEMIAYQRFLDRFESAGREYRSIEVAREYCGSSILLVLQAKSQPLRLPGGVDPNHPPPGWVSLDTKLDGLLAQPFRHKLRAFRVVADRSCISHGEAPQAGREGPGA